MFTLTVKPEAIAGYLDGARERVAQGTANPFERDAVWWLPHVHPLAPFADRIPRYRCDLLDDASGRCTVYATRPQTCREYPSQEVHGAKCLACGFTIPSEDLVQLTKAPTLP